MAAAVSDYRPIATTYAFVLGFVGGLVTALSVPGTWRVLADGYSAGFRDTYTVVPQGSLRIYYWSAAILDPAVAILLIGGALLLFFRRELGRILLTAGCALVIALGVFGAVVKPDLFGVGQAGAIDKVLYLVPLVFPVATIVLAWSRRTSESSVMH
ncbi:hypothetical protein [Nocardia sp. XZ_19_385]|uniref:hypothetical protein n=1 Tax=Nocardia sp. XZ_19_385 TaxID=2769488 RepID=UPI00188E7DB0|nr:hypothetical protein [Nocardia sp. XZ_19_385]